jgi:hydroxypyruvate reductase
MNTVRKHLSAIKGGRLAAAASPAKVVALMISDVPGDDPSIIASGPTVPDPSTNAQALAIIEKYGIDVPKAVLGRLRTADETPKPSDKRLARVENIMIATPQASLEAAAAVAEKAGVKPVILGDSIEGESRDVALVHAGIARQCALRGQPEKPPCVLISGGETTITLKGKGKGGRNTEFLLALAIALDGMKGIYALAGDTDGIDGSEDNAGAVLAPDALERAKALRLEPKKMLAANDGYGFFSALGDLVVTGPTRTNVNDYRVILVV